MNKQNKLLFLFFSATSEANMLNKACTKIICLQHALLLIADTESFYNLLSTVLCSLHELTFKKKLNLLVRHWLIKLNRFQMYELTFLIIMIIREDCPVIILNLHVKKWRQREVE